MKLHHYLWAPWWIDFSLRKVSGLMIPNAKSLLQNIISTRAGFFSFLFSVVFSGLF